MNPIHSKYLVTLFPNISVLSKISFYTLYADYKYFPTSFLLHECLFVEWSFINLILQCKHKKVLEKVLNLFGLIVHTRKVFCCVDGWYGRVPCDYQSEATKIDVFFVENLVYMYIADIFSVVARYTISNIDALSALTSLISWEICTVKSGKLGSFWIILW